MIGKRIKYLREMKGLTQKELAKIIGISTSELGMIEQGRRNPRHIYLEMLADELDTTSDYLLGRTELIDNIVTRKDLKELLGKGSYPEWVNWIELAKYMDKAKLTPDKVKELLEKINTTMDREG